jgi:hypothetical protein
MSALPLLKKKETKRVDVQPRKNETASEDKKSEFKLAPLVMQRQPKPSLPDPGDKDMTDRDRLRDLMQFWRYAEFGVPSSEKAAVYEELARWLAERSGRMRAFYYENMREVRNEHYYDRDETTGEKTFPLADDANGGDLQQAPIRHLDEAILRYSEKQLARQIAGLRLINESLTTAAFTQKARERDAQSLDQKRSMKKYIDEALGEDPKTKKKKEAARRMELYETNPHSRRVMSRGIDPLNLPAKSQGHTSGGVSVREDEDDDGERE